jgi:PTH1 family peptidyl-tRNA hydrolase
MDVVVGLGNPGPSYVTTRHNVGFMVIERLAERWQIELNRSTDDLRFGLGRYRDRGVGLVQPQSFMNLSGEALLPFVEELGTQTASLIVVHDDIDLPFGQLRLKRGGGTGGHRGLESLVGRFGAGFDRVRVGVGRPKEGGDAAGWVLSSFAPEEQEVLAAVVDTAAEAVEALIDVGIVAAMNRYNQRVPGATRESQEE